MVMDVDVTSQSLSETDLSRISGLKGEKGEPGAVRFVAQEIPKVE